MDGRIDLERARRDAKALLRAAQAGEAVLRDDREPRLADAQHAVAVSLGAASWPALVRVVEAGDALIEAARAGSREEVYRLLVEGAPPNARDASGATALHVAAAAGWPDVVDVLVGWVPVDRGAVDHAGRTALDGSSDPVVARMLAPGPVAEVDIALGDAAWAAEAALFEYLASSPLASRRAVGDGFAFRTGMLDNTRNGVVCSRCSDVGEVLEWLDAPAQWLVPAGSSLELPGCEPERTAVFMAAPVGLPSVVEGITEVRDAAVLLAALVAVDELEHDPAEAALLASLGLSPDRPLRQYAAWRDGVVAGLVSTFSSGSTLTVTTLAVAPGWRRRGIGRGLVQHALHSAAGHEVALLAPTPATIPFYARQGFRLLRFPRDRVFYTPFGRRAGSPRTRGGEAGSANGGR